MPDLIKSPLHPLVTPYPQIIKTLPRILCVTLHTHTFQLFAQHFSGSEMKCTDWDFAYASFLDHAKTARVRRGCDPYRRHDLHSPVSTVLCCSGRTGSGAGQLLPE